MNHPLAFFDVDITWVVVGAIEQTTKHISFSTPFHAKHSIDGVVEDVGVSLDRFLVVLQSLV